MDNNKKQITVTENNFWEGETFNNILGYGNMGKNTTEIKGWGEKYVILNPEH